MVIQALLHTFGAGWRYDVTAVGRGAHQIIYTFKFQDILDNFAGMHFSHFLTF